MEMYELSADLILFYVTIVKPFGRTYPQIGDLGTPDPGPHGMALLPSASLDKTAPSDTTHRSELDRAAIERRVFDRVSTALPARVFCGVKAADCTVTNLSAGGAQLRGSPAFDIAAIVTIKFERFGSFHARVVWRRNERIGIKFLEDSRSVVQRFAALL